MPPHPSWLRTNERALQARNTNDTFPQSCVYSFAELNEVINSLLCSDRIDLIETNGPATDDGAGQNSETNHTSTNQTEDAASEAWSEGSPGVAQSRGSLPYLLRVPLEIRQMIYIQNSLISSGTTSRYEHRISGTEYCCRWRYGEPLSLCDQNPEGLSSTETPFFLPSLGHLNQQTRGEMARHLLRKSGKIVLNSKHSRSVKISTYFADFLQAVSDPNDWNAFDSVHELEFLYFG